MCDINADHYLRRIKLRKSRAYANHLAREDAE